MSLSRSEMMERIGSEDTKPELKLRKALWHSGLRYRKHRRIGRVKPDLVFVGPRVAVFVDGCFWHGCPDHYVMPRSNHEFWQNKLAENVERDARNTRNLRAKGWFVVRLWEHEVETNLERCVQRVRVAVEGESSEEPLARMTVSAVKPTDDESRYEHNFLQPLGSPDEGEWVFRERDTSKW